MHKKRRGGDVLMNKLDEQQKEAKKVILKELLEKIEKALLNSVGGESDCYHDSLIKENVSRLTINNLNNIDYNIVRGIIINCLLLSRLKEIKTNNAVASGCDVIHIKGGR